MNIFFIFVCKHFANVCKKRKNGTNELEDCKFSCLVPFFCHLSKCNDYPQYQMTENYFPLLGYIQCRKIATQQMNPLKGEVMNPLLNKSNTLFGKNNLFLFPVTIKTTFDSIGSSSSLKLGNTQCIHTLTYKQGSRNIFFQHCGF